MKYNRPHGTAAWGMMAKDWEQGVDYHRLSVDRLKLVTDLDALALRVGARIDEAHEERVSRWRDEHADLDAHPSIVVENVRVRVPGELQHAIRIVDGHVERAQVRGAEQAVDRMTDFGR